MTKLNNSNCDKTKKIGADSVKTSIHHSPSPLGRFLFHPKPLLPNFNTDPDQGNIIVLAASRNRVGLACKISKFVATEAFFTSWDKRVVKGLGPLVKSKLQRPTKTSESRLSFTD